MVGHARGHAAFRWRVGLNTADQAFTIDRTINTASNASAVWTGMCSAVDDLFPCSCPPCVVSAPPTRRPLVLYEGWSCEMPHLFILATRCSAILRYSSGGAKRVHIVKLVREDPKLTSPKHPYASRHLTSLPADHISMICSCASTRKMHAKPLMSDATPNAPTSTLLGTSLYELH